MNDQSTQPAPDANSGVGDKENPAVSDDADSPAPQSRDDVAQEKTAHEDTAELTDKALVVIEDEDHKDGWFTRFMIRLGLRSGGTLRDDLNEALSGNGEAGDVFSPEERAMLQNILRLRERRVVDVMVPRAEVHAVGVDATLNEVLREFEETGHSRLPVYNDTPDDPRGMVLIKDLLLHMTKLAAKKNGRPKKNATKELDLSRIDLNVRLADLNVTRKVLFVPPSMLASDLMARMQATRTQMALVIDEYGGTDGLVTLEDIVEEVVGEIEDEHDEDEADGQQITAKGDGIWTADGRVELEKLTSELGSAFNPGEHGEEVDTLAGLVFALAGHVPVRGEVVTGVPGYEFHILDADPRRIKELQVVQTNLRDKRRKAAGN